jgi:phosphonopyruvate decarboxylase
MIRSETFVESARRHGFVWYAGVPCSFLTPLINRLLRDDSIHYLCAANEGDAVALIAGVTLGVGAHVPMTRGVSLMQNSGLSNAVSPLTSLTWTFRLPQLLIVTWRGEPGFQDEPQHELMGSITPSLLSAMQIPWELLPSEHSALEPAFERAIAYMNRTARPYAFIVRKGAVAVDRYQGPLLPPERALVHERNRIFTEARRNVVKAERPSRTDVLRAVIQATSEASTAVLASTGYCGRELYALRDRSNHFYMVGSMGCVLPLALGLALSRPDIRVVAVDGDGSALMRMGAFATVGTYGPSNLSHLLLDNGEHESTGGQATVSPSVDFARIAVSCGYQSALEMDRICDVSAWLKQSDSQGPRFARFLMRPGYPPDLPRPSLGPEEVKTRFMAHFARSNDRGNI